MRHDGRRPCNRANQFRFLLHHEAKIFTIFEGTSEIQRMIIGHPTGTLQTLQRPAAFVFTTLLCEPVG
jgi:hypothetical protein